MPYKLSGKMKFSMASCVTINFVSIFEQNANFGPIFEKSAYFGPIFEKSVNFEHFVNGRWTHYSSYIKHERVL